MENLQEYTFEHEQEAALAKLRMEAHKQAENENLEDEEIEESEEMDAKNRQLWLQEEESDWLERMLQNHSP